MTLTARASFAVAMATVSSTDDAVGGWARCFGSKQIDSDAEGIVTVEPSSRSCRRPTAGGLLMSLRMDDKVKWVATLALLGLTGSACAPESRTANSGFSALQQEAAGSAAPSGSGEAGSSAAEPAAADPAAPAASTPAPAANGGAAPSANPNDRDDDPFSDSDDVSDDCVESTSTSDSVSNPDSVSNNDGIDDDGDGLIDEDSESDDIDSESSVDVGCEPTDPPAGDTPPANPELS